MIEPTWGLRSSFVPAQAPAVTVAVNWQSRSVDWWQAAMGSVVPMVFEQLIIGDADRAELSLADFYVGLAWAKQLPGWGDGVHPLSWSYA